jgi:hypothetical protein
MTDTHKGDPEMVSVKLKYLVLERSRHGKLFLYVRLPGRKKIRLLVDGPNDPNFVEAYATAMRGEQWRPPAPQVESTATALQKALPGTFRALCEDYFPFLAKDPRVSKRTKYTRRQHLEHVCPERLS